MPPPFCLRRIADVTGKQTEESDLKNLFTTRQLTRGALIAALYTAISLALAPISMGYGGIELRVAEALTLLPVLLPEAVPALAVGCLLTNLFAGGTPWDIVFGTLATLLAALCTRKLRGKPVYIAALPPVLFNAVVVGAVLRYTIGLDMSLLAWMGVIGAGQAIACYVLGIPLLLAVRRLPEKILKA